MPRKKTGRPRGRPRKNVPPVNTSPEIDIIPPSDIPPDNVENDIEIIPPDNQPNSDVEIMTENSYRSLRTLDRKKRALEAYSELGIVTHACLAAGIDRRTWYDWLESDPQFALDAKAAEDAAIDSLVAEAHRRGLAKSDILLMFSIKAKRPEYRDKQQVDVQMGGEIRVRFVPAQE